MNEKKSVVVMGGGTGTYTILRGLKKFSEQIEITAVVTMADSGGSTGRLRDEFGMLPVGDARMALAALAADNMEGESLLRDLFLYRFQNGNGLRGHNLGNLLLTALTDLLGNEAAAIAAASRILRLSGSVLPVTTNNSHLTAIYDDGVFVEGEHNIDDPEKDRFGHRIKELSLNPVATINNEVSAALRAADLIVIGPGDLYSSLLANIVVSGVPEAISSARAKVVYIANLMERLGQTEGMTVSDCVNEIERYLRRAPDVILINNAPLPRDVVELYATIDGTKPVIDDADDSVAETIVRTDLISHQQSEKSSSDTVVRSLIRHDSDKLASAVISLLT